MASIHPQCPHTVLAPGQATQQESLLGNVFILSTGDEGRLVIVVHSSFLFSSEGQACDRKEKTEVEAGFGPWEIQQNLGSSW